MAQKLHSNTINQDYRAVICNLHITGSWPPCPGDKFMSWLACNDLNPADYLQREFWFTSYKEKRGNFSSNQGFVRIKTRTEKHRSRCHSDVQEKCSEIVLWALQPMAVAHYFRMNQLGPALGNPKFLTQLNVLKYFASKTGYSNKIRHYWRVHPQSGKQLDPWSTWKYRNYENLRGAGKFVAWFYCTRFSASGHEKLGSSGKSRIPWTPLLDPCQNHPNSLVKVCHRYNKRLAAVIHQVTVWQRDYVW